MTIWVKTRWGLGEEPKVEIFSNIEIATMAMKAELGQDLIDITEFGMDPEAIKDGFPDFEVEKDEAGNIIYTSYGTKDWVVQIKLEKKNLII